MRHVRSLILEVLETVYTNRELAEQTVFAHFERVERETAPEIDELRARIEKLEQMLVWAYSFTSDDMVNFSDIEQIAWAGGGRPPDSVEWGVGWWNVDLIAPALMGIIHGRMARTHLP